MKTTGNFEDITSKEFIVTNGLGGYCASTICGLNTRKYHGLLVYSETPPTNRKVIISKLLDTVTVDNQKTELSSNQYPGTVHPKGYLHLTHFDRKPLPKQRFQGPNFDIEKTTFMTQGEHTTIVKYLNLGNKAIQINTTPLIANRNIHQLQKEKSLHYKTIVTDKKLTLHLPENKTAYINISKGLFTEEKNNYKDTEYLKEYERGFDFKENLQSTHTITATIKPQEAFYVSCSTNKDSSTDFENLLHEEEERLMNLVPKEIKSTFTKDLIIAANQFLVDRASTQTKSIIAGYPWFTDWGRDTMIVILSYLLPLKKHTIIKEIIKTFLLNLNQGIIPNRFPDDNQKPEYNTVDGTLWACITIYKYYQETNDTSFLREIYPDFIEIINWHIKGTHYNIHTNNRGFIEAGTPDTQLTWMDAQIGTHIETPRNGSPVEICALFYNTLKAGQHFSKELNTPFPTHFETIIKDIKKNFKTHFLNDQQYLNDVISPQKVDASFRPNQLFVLNLPFKLLNKIETKAILKQIEEKLLTPYGLRTLAPNEKAYKPCYDGSPWDRDTAYHQGTVWPFLLGEYLNCLLELDPSDKTKQHAEQLTLPLKDHFYKNECLHGISEVFDGTNPSEGKGCFHQAWSVSGILGPILKHRLFE